MNTATQINDALEATADFCREANDNKTTMANTKDVDNIQVYQGITVHGMVLFEDNKAEPVPNKTYQKGRILFARIRNYADHNLEQTN